jgi:hypothetical protein
MNAGDHVSEARARLHAAEERAERAEQRVAEARRDLKDAADGTAREALEHELGVHQRAAETHRRAAELQRVHLEHEQRGRV